MKNKREKIIIIITILLSIINLSPMVYMAKYCYSSADDYTYGIETHHIWNETHSIINVVKTSFIQTGEVYKQCRNIHYQNLKLKMQSSIHYL